LTIGAGILEARIIEGGNPKQRNFEFREIPLFGIPRKIMPIPTEVRKYGNEKFRQNYLSKNSVNILLVTQKSMNISCGLLYLFSFN
jgi:hypothetical protein